MTWTPQHWYRVVRDVPRPLRSDIWSESGDEEDELTALADAPFPARMERLWEHRESEWRPYGQERTTGPE